MLFLLYYIELPNLFKYSETASKKMEVKIEKIPNNPFHPTRHTAGG